MASGARLPRPTSTFGDSIESPRGTKRHTMALSHVEAETLQSLLGQHATPKRSDMVSVHLSFPLLKVSKTLSIAGAKTVAELRAAFLAGIDQKLLQAPKVSRALDSLVLFCPSGGFWCSSPSRTVSSYWFSPADSLALVKKKKGKELRVRFDGSVHVIEYLPEKATCRGLVQALPKLDIRNYDDYVLTLETEKRTVAVSDPKMSVSVLNPKPSDLFYFASPDDAPAQLSSPPHLPSSISSSAIPDLHRLDHSAP